MQVQQEMMVNQVVEERKESLALATGANLVTRETQVLQVEASRARLVTQGCHMQEEQVHLDHKVIRDLKDPKA